MKLNYGMINDRSPHIIADLCEISCFFENIEISRSDIEEFITNNGGSGLLHLLHKEEDSGAENNERMQKLTEDAFQHLMYRQTAFGTWYPFKVNHDVIELDKPESVEGQIYINLLCHSRLKMFDKTRRAKLASEFESICCFAMEGLFPTWSIYHFGAGGRDRSVFGNKLSDAIAGLAGKLRDDLHPRRVAKLSVHNVGDAGIDFIALHEWTDPAEAVPAYFAQCAAQQEGWPEKRFEAHPVSASKYINFFCPPGSILFIPLCYRGPDGDWIDSDGYNSLLVDRLRLVELLGGRFARDESVKSEILKVFSKPFARGSFNSTDHNSVAA